MKTSVIDFQQKKVFIIYNFLMEYFFQQIHHLIGKMQLQQKQSQQNMKLKDVSLGNQQPFQFNELSNACDVVVKKQVQMEHDFLKYLNVGQFYHPQNFVLENKKINKVSRLQEEQNLKGKKEKQKNSQVNIGQDCSKKQLKQKINIEQNTQNKKVNRKRPTDHNICKKYHTVANKCLKKLGLYQFIQPQLKKIYKRNYFMLALIIADKAQQLKKFKKIYALKIKLQSRKYKKMLEGLNFGSPDQSYYIQLMNSMDASIECINVYQKAQIHKSIQKLFNQEKLKRQSWIEQAFAEVLQFSKNIQMQIERVLIRI